MIRDPSLLAANIVCSLQMNRAVVEGTVIQFSAMSLRQLHACIGLLLPNIQAHRYSCFVYTTHN